MAGMLPGVECARRRGFHRGGERRSSFCLYAGGRKTHPSRSSPRVSLAEGLYQSESFLDETARKARERLDERLRTTSQRTPTRVPDDIMRKPKEGSQWRMGPGLLEMAKSLHQGWKLLPKQKQENDDCAVCLEEMDSEDQLVQLPCFHRFHSNCFSTWLETNSLCPCCRMDTSSFRHPS